MTKMIVPILVLDDELTSKEVCERCVFFKGWEDCYLDGEDHNLFQCYEKSAGFVHFGHFILGEYDVDA